MKYGWVIVDKPAGVTSMHVVRKVTNDLVRRFNIKSRDLKVGHGGTLDPFATGLLPIAFGEATKLLQLFMNESKAYVFTMVFGEKRDTGDVTGKVVETDEKACDKIDGIEEVLKDYNRFKTQTPHKMSAIRVNGKRAYDLFRAGEEYELEARDVEIYEIKLLEMDMANKSVTVYVKCGKGLYVRSLCEDIAAVMGTVAYVSKLDRVEYGLMGVRGYGKIDMSEECVSEISEKSEKVKSEKDEDEDGNELECVKEKDWTERYLIRDIIECKDWFPSIEIEEEMALKFKCYSGDPMDLDVEDGSYMLIYQGKILSIVNVVDKKMKLSRVLNCL